MSIDPLAGCRRRNADPETRAVPLWLLGGWLAAATAFLSLRTFVPHGYVQPALWWTAFAGAMVSAYWL